MKWLTYFLLGGLIFTLALSSGCTNNQNNDGQQALNELAMAKKSVQAANEFLKEKKLDQAIAQDEQAITHYRNAERYFTLAAGNSNIPIMP